MKTAIITSTKDIAGMNIREKLINLYPFKEAGSFDGNKFYSFEGCNLYCASSDTVHLERIDMQIDADIFIFATRHQSTAGRPSLSCHFPGNWGNADFGGKPRKVCIAPTDWLRVAFQNVQALVGKLDFEVSTEQTHHGPELEKPVFFIEIGSSETEWNNPSAGIVIALAIMNTIENMSDKQTQKAMPTVMILGGGHYNQTANKVLEKTDYAVGHICAKHQLGELTEESLSLAFNRHTKPVDKIILDWKGLGAHKQHVVSLIEKLGYRYERSQTFLK